MMAANDLITKLKAHGSPSDFHDLDCIYKEYLIISKQLCLKDKGVLALNILCILCRNLEKVPNWRNNVDNGILLTLSTECVRATTSVKHEDQVKVLACVYHLHKYAVKQKIPVESVLKLSYLPFKDDTDKLLKEYNKTYWAIIADRLQYIEKLKAVDYEIKKLLPKLTSDVLKTMHLFPLTQLCTDVIPIFIKKILFLYGENYPNDLNNVFYDIFNGLIPKTDVKDAENISEAVIYNIYKEFLGSVAIVIENSVRINFENSALDACVKFAKLLFGSKPDLYHCIQTFYLNVFCDVFVESPNSLYLETIVKNFETSCSAFEKLGYDKAMFITLPYVSNSLRIYIEYVVKNFNKQQCLDLFSINIQESYIKVVIFLLKRLGKTEQLSKCENCSFRSGIHDSLRLSFLIKHFVTISLNNGMDLTKNLPLILQTFDLQKSILKVLDEKKCCNVEKFSSRSQSDVHNTAIMLYQAKIYDYSVKLFEKYIETELKFNDNKKNVSRCLYNKALCEFEANLHERALESSFLCLVLSGSDTMKVDKYMNLVIDIKSKLVKDDDGSELCRRMQSTSVLDACRKCKDNENYGSLRGFFQSLEFSKLLHYEFARYKDLWPSLAPISGVWRSLHDLLKGNEQDWLRGEDSPLLLEALLKVVLETADCARNIQGQVLHDIITDIILRLKNYETQPLKYKLVYATLLLFKSEYEINEGSIKYGWNASEKITDPDQVPLKTIAQEHQVIENALKAVDVLTDILPQVKGNVTESLKYWIESCLNIIQIYVHYLANYMRDAHSIQLAYVCCELADCVAHKTTYARNVGFILGECGHLSEKVQELFRPVSYDIDIMLENSCDETILTCFCEAAIYFVRTRRKGLAARLVQFIQAQILSYHEKNQPIPELAFLKLMEAQIRLCPNAEMSSFSALGVLQKYSYGLKNNASLSWCRRRLRTAMARSGGARACGAGAGAGAGAAAGAAAGAGAGGARGGVAGGAGAARGALVRAAVLKAQCCDVVRNTIENRLKRIISPDTIDNSDKITNGISLIAAKEAKEYNASRIDNVEMMLEHRYYRANDTSPSYTNLSVPAFKMPDFFIHSKKCKCYACFDPYASIIALQISKLEASLYFRSKEYEIACNYFDGATKMIDYIERKINYFLDDLKVKRYEPFVLEIVRRKLERVLLESKIELLIENSFLELATDNLAKADDFIVVIHELFQEMDGERDAYIYNSYLNLVAASNKLKEMSQRTIVANELGIENELENIQLSPKPNDDKPQPTTPEQRPEKPPEVTKSRRIVKVEDLPQKKLSTIKFDLDKSPEKVNRTRNSTRKAPDFKIPVPKLQKPVPETITPRPTRSRPNIKVTNPSLDLDSASECFMTPNAKADISNTDFYTPQSSKKPNEVFMTPKDDGEVFFTPMTSLKTYGAKKTLRQQAVKNLEQDFQALKLDDTSKLEVTKLDHPPNSSKSDMTSKESGETTLDETSRTRPKLSKVETGSLKMLKAKQMLKRATSPGKLAVDPKPVKAKNFKPKLNLSPEKDTSKASVRKKK